MTDWPKGHSIGRGIAILAAVVCALSGSAHADSDGRGTIVLTVAVDTSKGRVLCGIYERSGWLKRPLKGSVASIRGNTAACRFAELRPGQYAAGAFQDVNSNGRLDRNWVGMPREPWCVSRGSRGSVGPPSFAAASFEITEGTLRLSCHAS